MSLYSTTILSDSPIVYLRLGDLSGTTAADSSGNGFSGVLTGGFTPGLAGAIAGDNNAAVLFDGSSGYVDAVGSVSTFAFLQNTAVFTFECWFKLTDFTAAVFNSFFGNTDGGAGSGTGSQAVFDNRSGTKRLSLSLWNDAISALTFNATLDNLVADDHWHYLAIVVNGVSSATAYLDSVPSAMTINTTGAFATGNSARVMQIGSINPDVPGRFNGMLDEVAFYATALSAGRVLAHYNAGITQGRAAPIIGSSLIARRR